MFSTKDHSTSAAYMLQLSNASLQNGLVTEDQVKLALKLNLLFFDEAQVSAPAILRNDVLFDMWKAEPSAMAEVFRDFLRPVLTDKRGTIDTVAAAITQTNPNGVYIGFHRGRGLSSPTVDRATFEKEHLSDMLSFARAISDSRPTYRFASPFEQEEYVQTYLTVAERYVSLSTPEELVMYRYFHEQLLLEEKGNSKLKNRDIVKIADETRARWSNFPDDIYWKLCSSAFITMELIARPIDAYEFSSTASASSIIDHIERSQFLGSKAKSSSDLVHSEPSEFFVDLPIDSLLQLKMQDVLLIRADPNVRALRSEIARFRRYEDRLKRTGKTSVHLSNFELEARFRGAAEFINHFMSATPSDRRGLVQQSRLLVKIEKTKKGLALLKALSSVNNPPALISSLIEFQVPTMERQARQLDIRLSTENRQDPLGRWDIARGQSLDA